MSRLSRAALGYLDHYCAGFWIGPAAAFRLAPAHSTNLRLGSDR
jgi:hypothetical protein